MDYPLTTGKNKIIMDNSWLSPSEAYRSTTGNFSKVNV